MWELASIGIMFRRDGNGPLGGDSKSSFWSHRWINCEQCERLNYPFFGFVYHFGCALVKMSIGSGLVSLRPFTSIILMAKCISVPYKIEFAQD